MESEMKCPRSRRGCPGFAVSAASSGTILFVHTQPCAEGGCLMRRPGALPSLGVNPK